MKDYPENRIAREDLLGMLNETINGIKHIKENNQRIITQFSAKQYGKSFFIVKDGVFSKKLITMDDVIFNEIITHKGRASYVHDHIFQFDYDHKRTLATYEYYDALLNTTFPITFEDFNKFNKLLHEVREYNMETLLNLLTTKFNETPINLRSISSYY